MWWPAAGQVGGGQAELVGGLDIGDGAEHGQQFGDVGEAGEAVLDPVGAAVGGQFEVGHGPPEGGGPGVEVLDAGCGPARRVGGSAA